MTRYDELIADYIASPSALLQKEPFTRGSERDYGTMHARTAGVGETTDAVLPNFKRRVVTQEQFMRELDPNCHDVLFDMNIPSICVKVADGSYVDIRYEKLAVPFQKKIKDSQVQHLAGNPMDFTLIDQNPSDSQMRNFQLFKQYWKRRNQDGMKKRLADRQLSLGDAGLLYYFDRYGKVKSRILSYDKGYVLCPHDDDNGDRICEAVYYLSGSTEYIDMYTDRMMYRFTNDYAENGSESGWSLVKGFPVEHGFSEIPLITKRGDVAWNDVQLLIESYEVLYNVFNAIQKRFGWGLLYIKGKFADKGQKIAGSVVLNDTSMDGHGDAKFLTPPTPEGTLSTLEKLEESIQKGSSTTFILPKDVKTSGDVSGIAIQLTQSLDLEKAEQLVIDYQNVADKMVRLFKEGLAKELVSEGVNPNAVTEFSMLDISASFRVWRPFSKAEYNQMLLQLAGGGLISRKTGIEKNTEATPDEYARIMRQHEDDQAIAAMEGDTETTENADETEE